MSNKSPRRYGFNFQWMLHYNEKTGPKPVDLRILDFMAETGFNFARVPMDYRYWIKDFQYDKPNEAGLNIVDQYVEACRQRGIHLSLNMHRVPGYCIMNNDWERHNLWTDQEALDGLLLQWGTFARRYRGITSDALSFDLINEPPRVGQYGCTRASHENVIRKTYAAIRAIDPDRKVVIDGLGGGNYPIPELADLPLTQSLRGYQPMALTHFGAPWWKPHAGLPEPEYPGLEWQGVRWDKQALREFYEPWRDLSRRGVEVHVGEFGCYTVTPNWVALKWFEDLLSLYQEFGWGYALWEFDGTFGVMYHGRPGAVYENYKGLRIDRSLLDLLLKYRA